jgi:hypothetical protein
MTAGIACARLRPDAASIDTRDGVWAALHICQGIRINTVGEAPRSSDGDENSDNVDEARIHDRAPQNWRGIFTFRLRAKT